jgi:hypothetical protein
MLIKVATLLAQHSANSWIMQADLSCTPAIGKTMDMSSLKRAEMAGAAAGFTAAAA